MLLHATKPCAAAERSGQRHGEAEQRGFAKRRLQCLVGRRLFGFRHPLQQDMNLRPVKFLEAEPLIKVQGPIFNEGT